MPYEHKIGKIKCEICGQWIPGEQYDVHLQWDHLSNNPISLRGPQAGLESFRETIKRRRYGFFGGVKPSKPPKLMKSSDIQTCEYCGQVYPRTSLECPRCTAPNPKVKTSLAKGIKTIGESMKIKIVGKGAQLAFFFVLGALLISFGGMIGGPWVGIAAILAGLYIILPNEAEILERVLAKEQKKTSKPVRVLVQ